MLTSNSAGKENEFCSYNASDFRLKTQQRMLGKKNVGKKKVRYEPRNSNECSKTERSKKLISYLVDRRKACHYHIVPKNIYIKLYNTQVQQCVSNIKHCIA